MQGTRIIAIAATLGGLLLGASYGPARAQDKAHWLVGTWIGDVEGMRSSKYGTTRTMRIGEVMGDGTLKVGWAATGEPKIGNATARFSGERIELVTNENTKIELTKSGETTLQGTFTPTSGRPYPIRMKKQ